MPARASAVVLIAIGVACASASCESSVDRAPDAALATDAGRLVPGGACSPELEQRCVDDLHVVVCRSGAWALEGASYPGCTPGEIAGRCGSGGGPIEGCPCATFGWATCSWYCGGRWESGPMPGCGG